MTRTHRAAHRLAWPLIGLLAACAFLSALLLRAPADPVTNTASQTEAAR